MTPEIFAEYRERGFNWAEFRQLEPWDIEPPTYWGFRAAPLPSRDPCPDCGSLPFICRCYT